MSYGFGYINDLVYRAHTNAARHGFWDGKSMPPDCDTILIKCCLIGTEVSEVAEEARKPTRDIDAFAEELADICIRVFDLAGAMGCNLEQAILDKMAHNEARPYKHGKLA